MQTDAESTGARSAELFSSGYFCAESVLQAVAESKGVDSELIPRIATGLCSGMARTGGVCGAASGAVLAISMVRGRNGHSESVEENYRLIRNFLGEFESVFGSTNCERLLGCRLDTAEGQKVFKENRLSERCHSFTRGAAEMASRLLANDRIVP